MSVENSIRHHQYEGFRSTLKTIGTGPRGSRALSFDEARTAMTQLLAGEISDVQAGAFLIAMRVKGEEADELAGMAQALRDSVPSVAVGCERPLVACAGAYDGVASVPHLSLAAGVLSAACGAGVVMHCGDTLGPKYGSTVADVLHELGGPARPSLADSAGMLSRAGVCVVHAGEALPGWRRLAEIRDQVGLRGPVHSAEKLVNWFGAERFVIGHTHGAYAELLVGALKRLGSRHAVAVRGLEGSDVMRPGRPLAFEHDRMLEFPEMLGARIDGEGGAGPSAWLTRVVLSGEADEVLTHTLTLNAGVRSYVAGVAPDPLTGAREARAALEDGRAVRTLEALLA